MRGDECNRRFRALRYVRFVTAATLLSGCAAPQELGTPASGTDLSGSDDRYDSRFPQQDAAPVIEDVAASVLMVSSLAFHKIYSIPARDTLQVSRLLPGALDPYESGARFVSAVNVGASTVLSIGPTEILILTCAHVVTVPDTILSHHPTSSGGQSPWLSSVAIRERVTLTAAVLPEGGELELIAADPEADIALLGKHFAPETLRAVRAFEYPFGNTDDLDWGSFVYVLGYPRGQLMLTHGLVSLGRRPASEGFFIDAGMGRGFSGGPVLAIRDGLPSLELVGMARMMPGQTSLVLAPSIHDGDIEYDSTAPYTGEAYVRRQTELHYGMARAISAESILEFLDRNRERVVAAGYVQPSVRVHRSGQPTR